MSVEAGDPGARLGLRERKKLRTRQAIQNEAMRLFEANGYEETTVEQIAAAADISPSTFFNYFPSKEDVVLYDAYDPMIASLLENRPAGEPLSVSFRAVLGVIGDALERDREVVLARSRLMLQVPELRARLWEEVEKAQVFLDAAIAARTGRDPADFEIRVLMMAFVGGMMEAMREWVRQGGTAPFPDFLNRAFDVIDAGGRLDSLGSR